MSFSIDNKDNNKKIIISGKFNFNYNNTQYISNANIDTHIIKYTEHHYDTSDTKNINDTKNTNNKHNIELNACYSVNKNIAPLISPPPVITNIIKQYLSYNDVDIIYLNILSKSIQLDTSNKTLFQFLHNYRNKWNKSSNSGNDNDTIYKDIIDKDTLLHFINFCRYISYKISSYKSQDREKLKGDYASRVIKNGNNIKNNNIINTQKHSQQDKVVHTDSFLYIDNALYENKYFNIMTFLKLFVDTRGRCFYCEEQLNLKMTEKYMKCIYSNCEYYTEECDYTRVENEHENNTKHNIDDKDNKLRWSLERINNKLGHYQNNCVIACIGCNLKRRIQNHKSFKFTKDLQNNSVVKTEA
jgi:hypothetical protein